MNKVALVGRLVRDPDVRYTDGGLSIARFSIAVDRRFKKEEDAQNADFPNIICFGKTAEFIEKYFKQGQRIGMTGRIQTGTYTNKEGVKIYTTEVVAEEVEFVESKSNNNDSQSRPDPSKASNDGFVYASDCMDEELPFN